MYYLLRSMLQLYDKLLELPLFIGISTDELADIVGQTKFGFYKLVADKSLVGTDDKCTHLFFSDEWNTPCG